MLIINAHINIQDNSLINGLLPVLEIIHEIENSLESEIVIDFSLVHFASPLFVLPLMVYVNGCAKTISYCNISGYLNTIKFGHEYKPEQMRKSEFLAHMESYSKGNYIPIISFQALTNRDDEKGAIISTVEKIIISQLNLDKNIVIGLKYLIGETVDNITEHSNSERGYIFAQAYKQKGYIDICIADNGITLLGSYKKLPDNEIESDIEAMQAANQGVSTKNLPDAENRGYGIITSKKMLVKGLDGHFVMISGTAIHLKNREIDKYFILPQDIHWKGTIIALRIPYHNKKFNYINYLE